MTADRPGSAAGLPELLSTHPALEERIRAIRARARENGWAALPAQPYPEEVSAALGKS